MNIKKLYEIAKLEKLAEKYEVATKQLKDKLKEVKDALVKDK